MFFSLLSLVASNILSIDPGSENIKFAELDHNNDIYPYKIGGKKAIPGAIAFKSKLPLEKPIPYETMKNITIKTGTYARPILNKKPYNGYEYVIDAIAKKGTEFNTCKFANATEMFALYLNNLFNKIPKPSAAVVTYPSFFTPDQRIALQVAVKLNGVNVEGLYDDFSSMSVYWADKYINKIIEKQNYQVLFVDIGFQYTQIYNVNFSWNGNHTVAHERAAIWSEKFSTQAIARALSRSIRIPVSEAIKLIRTSQEKPDYANDEFIILRNLINEALNVGGTVDEVQIYGGGSKYEYIYDLVTEAVKNGYNKPDRRAPAKKNKKVDVEKTSKKAVIKHENLKDDESKENSTEAKSTTENAEEGKQTYNETINADSANDFSSTTTTNETTNETTPENKENVEPSPENNEKAEPTPEPTPKPTPTPVEKKVLRSFDADSAVAMAALHLYTHSRQISSYYPCYIDKKPFASYYVVVDNSREKICQKGSACRVANFFNHTGPQYVNLEADPRHVPNGVSPVLQKYELLNISEVELDETNISNGRFFVRSTEPQIDQIVWCNSANCSEIGFEAVNSKSEAFNETIEFYQTYVKAQILDKQVAKMKELIGKTIKKMHKLVDPPPNTESTIKVDESTKTKFYEFKEIVDSGKLETMSEIEIESMLEEMKPVALALGIKVE